MSDIANNTENATPEPNPINVQVPVLNMPNREEARSILKTGKSLDGTPVHPDTVQNLRKATIADLKAFGAEVNKATTALDNKINAIVDSFDLAIKDIHWNFATFLSFLGEHGVLKEDALTLYEAFKKKAEEDMAKVADFLMHKQKQGNQEANGGVVTPAPETLVPPVPLDPNTATSPKEDSSTSTGA